MEEHYVKFQLKARETKRSTKWRHYLKLHLITPWYYMNGSLMVQGHYSGYYGIDKCFKNFKMSLNNA